MDGFVEEVDFKELNFLEVVGRGAFGVVSRARWRGTDVAVKLIETESEKKAFITELKQLSRVVHPNIVKLYGASRVHPVCLVMEYAEGGSLYNVLHGSGAQPQYTAAHAVSWALQCACGVSYLHSMKPKPLVHRDLKPPNLLLIGGGTILKICDFGTACDAHTHMTNNKGSAAWMAPEVFEGSTYSEKCDVFSWGIILWEVLTRRKPFDEIGGPAFRIMWAVHNGTRPPLIRSCPKPLEILMCRCWSSNPVERPSMSEVERIMKHLYQFFEGADVPLVYPSVKEDQGENMMTGQSTGAHTIQQTMLPNQSSPHPSQPPTQDPPAGDLVNLPPVTEPKHVVVVEEEGSEDMSDQRRTSAPASLAASREHLPPSHLPPSTLAQFANKRFSADLSKLDEQDLISKMNSGMDGVTQQPARPAVPVRGHRRCGSCGSPIVTTEATSTVNSQATSTVAGQATGSGHRRTGSHGTSSIVTSSTPELTSGERLPHVTTAPDLGSHHTVAGYPVTGVMTPVNMAQRSTSWAPGMPSTNIQGLLGDMTSLNLISLDHELRPLPPCATCPESVSIHNQHCKYAYNYLQVQTEIALLKQQKDQLEDSLLEDQQKKHDAFRIVEEYTRLVNDNEQLSMLQKNLTRQLEGLKKMYPNKFGF